MAGTHLHFCDINTWFHEIKAKKKKEKKKPKLHHGPLILKGHSTPTLSVH
jgi:hypothetical protein